MSIYTHRWKAKNPRVHHPQEERATLRSLEPPRITISSQLTDNKHEAPGKLQLMEKFFTPLQPQQVTKQRHKDHIHHRGHHHPCDHQHHSDRHGPHAHPTHHHEPKGAEDKKGHGRVTPGIDSQDHGHSHHGDCSYCHHHHKDQQKQHHNSDMAGHTSTTQASSPSSSGSSSNSSSSSSSSSSPTSFSSSTWSSEASIDDEETFAVDRGQTLCRIRHSQSCTDISGSSRMFEEDEADEDTRPLLEDDGSLCKSASLERSLTLAPKLEVQHLAGTSKKSSSSALFPTKSILKSSHSHAGGEVWTVDNVRKAKSMEALSRHDSSASGNRPAGAAKPTVDAKQEEARLNLVREKLQFSAFLNEITRQVLSPSRLSSLGVANVSAPPSPRKASPGSTREQQEDRRSRPQQKRNSSPDSVASSAHSHGSKHQQYHHHHHYQHSAGGMSHSYRHAPEGHHSDTSTSPENNSSQNSGHHNHMLNLRQEMTDGTSTSPELSPCLPRHPPIQPHSHHRSQPYSPPYLPQAHQDVQSDSSHNTTSSSLEDKQAVLAGTEQVRYLQDQNKDLQSSLLQTTERLECMGAEFKISRQQLEVELQRTRTELNSLKDRFKRLQDNHASTQQTNHLLEQKLHSMAQNMGGEWDRLNQRISELTEQLASAKATIQTLENINVPSLLQEALEKHFHSEEAVNQLLLQATPPPAQFMDTGHLEKASTTRDFQVLGSVLEEGESDWSETSEEVQQIGRGCEYLPWRQVQGCWVRKGCEADTESESGGEEVRSGHLEPNTLQIPHLQFTVRREALPLAECKTSAGSQNHKPVPPTRLLSADLEEIRSAPKQPLKCARTLQDLHCPEGGDLIDAHNNAAVWKNRKAKGSGVSAGTAESSTALVRYQSATPTLSRFICHVQPVHGDQLGRVEVRGWAGGVTGQLLRGERTQL